MIIVGLIVALIIIVVIVNAMQQHKERLEQERRAKVAKLKAIIDDTEELTMNLVNIPHNPGIVSVLNARSLNAARVIKTLMPGSKAIKSRVQEMEARLEASKELASNSHGQEENFILPDNEQQLVAILQCIKKLRAVLKSEQSKGALDASTFMQEDQRLDAVQLKISVESMMKRGNQAYGKEMLGSARQYFEKAMQTLTDHPMQSEYTVQRKAELEDKLEEITIALKNTNAKDAAKKAKAEEDDLDMLFQPKKKW